MKKKSLLLFLFAFMAMVTYAEQTPATDNSVVMERKDVPTTEVGGLWWVLNDEEQTAYLAYKCNRRDVMDTEWLRDQGTYSGDIVIPETVNGYKVLGIWEFAFDGCENLSSVTLPSTIKVIGAYAFSQSSLAEITIPSSVEVVGDYGLSGNKLKTVIIEDGKKPLKLGMGSAAGVAPSGGTPMFGDLAFQELEEAYIGRPVDSQWPDLFHGNQTIKKVTFSDNAVGLSNSYFENCPNLESVVLGKGINRIGDLAFYGCAKLTAVNLPEGITLIGNSAFQGCELLTAIQFPSTLAFIGEYAFMGTALTEVTIPQSVEEIGVGGITIESLEKVTFEDGENILKMGVSMSGVPVFAGCKISEAYVGRDIESNIFHGNEYLKKMTFGDKVTKVFASFCEGTPVETLILGKNIKSIGENAFAAFWEGTAKLSEIYTYATTPPVCSDVNVFFNNIANCKLYVPNGCKKVYSEAPVWKEFFNIVEMDPEATEDVIEIPSIGKTTYCSEHDLDFSNVEGNLKAYTATGYDHDGQTIWLTRVLRVPSNTGVLVKGDPGTYKIPHSKVNAYYTNMFKGNLGDPIKIYETDGNMKNYYLSGKDGTFKSVNGSANIKKNKAYLQLPLSVFAGASTVGTRFDDEEGTTGIDNLSPAIFEGEGVYYNLQGQRVENPGKGIFILNGKMVVKR